MDDKTKLGMKMSFLYKYHIAWRLRYFYYNKVGKKLRTKHYAGTIVQSSEKGNNILREFLLSGKPFMAGRYGGMEIDAMAEVMHSEYRAKEYNYIILKGLNNNAGFVGTDKDDYLKFLKIMIESTKQCDLMCVWYNGMEDWFCEKYLPVNAMLTHRTLLDFWIHENPFTCALKGKKVVVVHPFSDSIEKQYKRRTELFENQEILPEFDLRTVKAVQTIGGILDSRFHTWFDALEYMYAEVMKEEFDVALIACGAYGYPLAAKIKESGKASIHMGGVLQVLFGIKGKRWDTIPEVKNLYNDAWIRPSKEEMAINYQKVEGGCYW